jgi:hypothetical protein
VIEAITVGFKTKTDSEGPCRHLLVKKYKKKHYRFGACHRSLFVKNIKSLAHLRFERGSRGRECVTLTAELGLGVRLEWFFFCFIPL